MEIERELRRFQEKFRGEIREAAYELLKEDMPVITEELYGLYEKTGNRLTFERVYFARRRFLAVLGLEALAQKEAGGNVERKVTEKLGRVIEDICQEECWALPPHVKREEEDWRVTVDLFAAETAQTLAELSDRLRDELPDSVREEAERNVENRVFLPFFTSKVPYRNWERGMSNWNGVCAGAVGSACIHLMKEEKRLQESLERICDGLQYYLKGFEEDGTCTEGLSYYTYGMGYFTNFAQELYDATGGQWDLFRGEWGDFPQNGLDKREKIAAFQRKIFFGDGRTVSFADSNSRGRFRVGLGCILALHYPSFAFPDFSSAAELDTNGCYHFAELKADLLMPERLIRLIRELEEGKAGRKEERGEETGLDVLPCAQWVIARASCGAGMACKGGHNMEFHNHNDVGHFIYEGAGSLFLTDLGAGEYCKGYFGENRYQVLCNRSLGHSVPLINGREQSAGREYACGSFCAREEGGVAVVDMELTGAYQRGTLKSFWRRLEFHLDTGMLRVCDTFDMGSPEGSAVENLVTQIKPVIRGNQVLLAEESRVCRLELAGGEEIRVLEYEHRNHKGIPEKVYGIQWDVVLAEGRGSSSFSMSVL